MQTYSSTNVHIIGHIVPLLRMGYSRTPYMISFPPWLAWLLCLPWLFEWLSDLCIGGFRAGFHEVTKSIRIAHHEVQYWAYGTMLLQHVYYRLACGWAAFSWYTDIHWSSTLTSHLLVWTCRLHRVNASDRSLADEVSTITNGMELYIVDCGLTISNR